MKISIKNGKLSIEIDFDTLVTAAKLSPLLEHYDEAIGEYRNPVITDAKGFAKDVVIELNREEEDGTTLVHRMFDQAFLRVAENGSEHILLG